MNHTIRKYLLYLTIFSFFIPFTKSESLILLPQDHPVLLVAVYIPLLIYAYIYHLASNKLNAAISVFVNNLYVISFLLMVFSKDISLSYGYYLLLFTSVIMFIGVFNKKEIRVIRRSWIKTTLFLLPIIYILFHFIQ
jgi:hypothetical protein